jgi:hypothetical protein
LPKLWTLGKGLVNAIQEYILYHLNVNLTEENHLGIFAMT